LSVLKVDGALWQRVDAGLDGPFLERDIHRTAFSRVTAGGEGEESGCHESGDEGKPHEVLLSGCAGILGDDSSG
jgi:hypothetical protein